MIYSMTAFGRSQHEEAGYAVTAEIRTVNSRNLDIVVRLPKNYAELEDSIRKQMGRSLRRGRVEVFVQIEPALIEQRIPQINRELAQLYWAQLQQLHESLPASDPPKLQDLLSIPYLFENNKQAPDIESVKPVLNSALSEALENLIEMRAREGESLLRDCLQRVSLLRRELVLLEQRKQQVIVEYRNRLQDRIKELLGETDIDENRLLQEVAYFAERSDINEEIVRVQSHLKQFEELLESSEPADGRRLDFLTQELHREVNTVGCKTGDLDAIQSVVRMKGEIGKLREQVQNIE